MNTDRAPAPAPATPPAPADRRVIVALDFDDGRAAEALVDRLGDACGFYKIGLELLTCAGPGLARDLVERGTRSSST